MFLNTESVEKKPKEELKKLKKIWGGLMILEEITRLIRRLKSQANAAKKYNDLKHTEKDLELKIAILFSLEAKRKKQKLDIQLELSYKKTYLLKNRES